MLRTSIPFNQKTHPAQQQRNKKCEHCERSVCALDYWRLRDYGWVSKAKRWAEAADIIMVPPPFSPMMCVL